MDAPFSPNSGIRSARLAGVRAQRVRVPKLLLEKSGPSPKMTLWGLKVYSAFSSQ